MFTGIVQEMGTVRGVEPLEEGSRLIIETTLPVDELGMGGSIALDGACMTVVVIEEGAFAVDVSAESLRCTTLGERVAGDRINLEPPLRANDLLGGHVVSGHIDGTGTIAEIKPEGESSIFTFSVPPELAVLTVEKGSVAIDGISLTCFNCREDSLDVAIIPHTLEVTKLGTSKPGTRVNIEADILGKYVAKLVDAALAARAGS